MTSATIEEVIILEGIDAEGAPLCELSLSTVIDHPCGKPSEVRVLTVCGYCGHRRVMFLCGGCKAIMQARQARCGDCKRPRGIDGYL